MSFATIYAQEEELTKEEKERREKNIQAGNPFVEFGYKAKVATLSKGKYLEVHDLDSIVKIGSSLSLNGKNIPISFHLPLYDTQGVFHNV